MASNDLRRALREATAGFTPEQTAALLEDPTVLMTYEAAFGEGVPTSVEDLISVAAEHGEMSKPEMEDGDLEAFIEAAQAIAG